ncbi:hypothetical protein MMC10_008520 [Thelotrema lepadinum]|nr:hypothetical protein [Thelotrema lepadinum]
MAVAYLAHGELAPYLSKHPGLFGFYDKACGADGIAVSLSVNDELYNPITHFSEGIESPEHVCGLLSPIDFGNFDTSLLDKYDEGTTSSESDSDSTPGRYTSPEDWYVGQSPLSRVTTTIRRAPATRIRRVRRRETASTSTSTATVTGKCDLERVDRLVSDIEQVIDGYSRLGLFPRSRGAATKTGLSVVRRLHNLRQYYGAKSKDLLLPEHYSRFHCPHQLFPSIRSPNHPLRQSPSNTFGTQPSVSLGQAVTHLRPMTKRLNLREELVSELVALHAAARAVRHLTSELACVKSSGPSLPTKFVTPALTLARNSLPLEKPLNPIPAGATTTQSYVLTKSSPSLSVSSYSSPTHHQPASISHDMWPASIRKDQFQSDSSPEEPTHSPHAAVMDRAGTLRRLANALDLHIEEAVQLLGLKAHQHTIMKKKLGGIGYLPLTS